MGWTKTYYGSVLPTSDGFALTSGDDATLATVRTFDGDSWLEFDDDAGATNSRFEATNSTAAKWDPTATTGWTVYLRVLVVANQIDLVIDDGDRRATIKFQTGTIDLDGTTSSQDLQRPRQIRITGKDAGAAGNTWNVYIDESDTSIASKADPGAATTSELLQFGSVTANSKVFIRALAYSVDADYLPTAQAAPDLSTTYVTPTEVRQFTGLDAASVSDGVVAKLIRMNEQRVDEIFAGRNGRRTKLIFGAGGTETDEDIDYDRSKGRVARTLYPFITTLSSLSYYNGSAYSTMTSGRDNDYYASTEDLAEGRIGINIGIPYTKDALRTTYTWGVAAANEIKRRQAAKLCLYMSAVDAFNAALQHGASDVFAERVEALKAEIAELTKEFAGQKRQPWLVL